MIEKSPFASVKLPTVRAGKTRFLSIEEEASLCQAIGQPYDAWIRLAILTGLRKSEQFGLRWADIDLERGLMTLPHTKSGAIQYVHLIEEAKQILRTLIPCNTSVWVFPSENPETHLDPDNFYCRVYMPALKDAKIDGVTWHTLRAYLRLTTRHEWTGTQYHCGPTSAQWNRIGGTVRPSLPYPLTRGT
jgi:integrase